MAIEAHSPLVPDPTCLHLTHLQASPGIITAVMSTMAKEAVCPVCKCRSDKVHSRYVRSLADLPWMGWVVRLELHTRRFFCLNLLCARQIFTERLPSVVEPYARRTNRLSDVLTLIGFVVGGEAGARLVEGMGLSTSPDTLLGLIQRAKDVEQLTPRRPGRWMISPSGGRLLEPYSSTLIDAFPLSC